MLKTIKALRILNEDLDRSKAKSVKLFDSYKSKRKSRFVFQARLQMRLSSFLTDKIKIKLKE